MIIIMSNYNLAKEGGLLFHIGNHNSEAQNCKKSTSSQHEEDIDNVERETTNVTKDNDQIKTLESLDKNGSGFFNPIMTVYRDFIVLTSKVLYRKQIECAIKFQGGIENVKPSDYSQSPFHFVDPFSGCGPLPIRIMTELVKTRKEMQQQHYSKSKASINCPSLPQFPIQISANDLSKDCEKLIRENYIQNSLIDPKLNSDKDDSLKFEITSKDANLLLHRINSFKDKEYIPANHIHLDPFGCCTPYLDSAMSALDIQVKKDGSSSGILSLTATDIGVLYDRRYIDNCRRHYNILHLNKKRSNIFREQAVRIILYAIASSAGRVRDAGIKKVLYAFPYAHFILVAVEIDFKSKNETIAKLKMSKGSEGPFYMGELFDSDFVHQMNIQSKEYQSIYSKDTQKLLETLMKTDCLYHSYQENNYVEIMPQVLSPWFHYLPEIAKKLELGSIPKKHKIISYLQDKGYVACGTVFDPNGIRLGGTLVKKKDERICNEEEFISQMILELIATTKCDNSSKIS